MSVFTVELSAADATALAVRLTPPLLDLLQACLKAGTGNARLLAQHLCISRQTVYTRTRRIKGLLDTHSLFDAALFAVNNGVIHPVSGVLPPRILKSTPAVLQKQKAGAEK